MHSFSAPSQASSCLDTENWPLPRPLRSRVFDERAESDVVRWNAVMVGYRKCGDVDAAREMLEAMTGEEHCHLEWDEEGIYKEALEIFEEMQREKVRPGKFVLSSLLASCANVGALDHSRVCGLFKVRTWHLYLVLPSIDRSIT
ncbi:hypothetical protein Acr_19g0001710 [Actinidia rufa]|uniref:Tetratricopeptide repeat (TPR)-like superfamily protein n=1 Tax=Actinidia rufa TaxID=165716 RepID=A0A7J0G8V6_9ERIC|nr:hypothetical protein Acr_19g0001710 [Actinidia rufa]